MESNSEKLERSNIQDVLDQTMIQKGMLFHYLNEDKSNLYNVQIALRLVGPLNENLFFKAIEKVQENNEVLRSVFDWEKIDKALQIILKQGQLKSKTYDLTAEKASDQLKLIQKILYHDQRKRFNLNQTPIRFLLLKCNKNEHIFVITHHHILYDGWSTGILLKELIDNYNHLNSEEALTKVKKPSYSEVVLKSIQAVNHDQQDDYWRQYLSGFSIGTGVPVTKSSADQEREVHKHSITLNAEKLNVFASENKITKASVLYSLYALLLHKYSGDEDVVFGITVSSRDPRVNGIDRLMGNFINSIPLRVSDIANRSFEEIAHQLQEDLKTHTPFFGTSLFEIKKILGLDPSENIFNSTVGIENYPLDKGLIDSIDGVAIDLYSLYENTNVDLALIVFIKDTLQVDFNYKGNKFDSGSIEILSRHFTKLLEKAIKEPSKKVKDLSLVSEQDIQMIEEFNKSEDGVEVSNHTYVSEFVSQSKRTPDHVAVVAGRESITYAELDQESDMVASYLATHAANEQYILLYCPISIEMIIAALGILKCGKAFVPLDPQMESDRSSNIIKQSRFGCLITNLKQKGELEFQGEVITWKRGDRKYEPYKGNEGRAESIAYLIYTSGTTGKPKGVKIKQSNLLNYSKWLQKYISLDPTCVSLLTSSFSFDLGYSSVFPVLISGGSVHMVNKDTYQNPDTLTSYIADHQITLLKLTPSLFSTFKEAENIYNNVLDSVETVLLGGESLHPEDIRSMSECYPSISFINHYGPTEATIGAIAHRIDNPHGVSEQIIGKPIAQNKVYILDNCNNIMPLGMQGQLCITGPGVGAGYLDDSKLTNEKFIKLGNAKYQLYKTGDLAKWLPNGTIQFLGREDRQVKIRGYRVELSEIEAKIASHPSVSEVAVLYLNNHLLVAYYVQKAELSHDELPEFLTKLLPDYMVPANFIRVDQIPLTANGKVDAKELSKIDYDNGPEYRSPTTELEKMLVMIWAEILGAERVGITDDFFTLGGDSIKSIQICSRVRRAGYELQVKEVLRYRTIQKISHRLKPRNVIADQSTIQGIADLTPIQRWLYESPIEHKDHYNQSVILEFDKIIDAITIDKIFTKLISHHDALRMRIVNVSDRWQIENLASDQYAEIIEVDLSGKKNKDKYQLEAANELQESIDVENGPLIKLCLFQDEGHCKLLIVVHHFVIDTISWRILVEDFNDLLNQVLKDEQLKLPLKTDAYLLWSTSLNEYINKKQHLESLDYWVSETQKQNEPLVRSGKPQINPIKTQTISRELDEQQTQRLLKGSGQYLKLEINDILLAALFLSMKETLGKNKMTIDLESHGREEAILNMDLSRTIGWFTTLFPFVFETSSTDTLMILRQLKDKLRKIPNGGLDYLLHRYYAKARSLKQQQSQIKFNYLGEFDFNKQAGNFHVTEDFKGLESNPEDWKGYDWEIVGLVRNNRLKLSISFVENWYDKSFVSSFLDSYQRQLMDVVEVCAHQTKRVLNPSDLTYSELSIQELDRLQQKYNIQDVYPLSPMQQGMLFHTLLNENAGHYNEQKMIAVTGKLNIDVFVKSLGDLVDSYPVLRTAFLHRDFEQPLQVVLSEREVNFEFIDLRDKMTDVEGEQLVESYCLKDQNINYDLEKDPLMKVTVLQLEDDRYKILWNHHHIMMDGWCMEMILQDVREFYRARLKNEQIVLPDPTPYSSYIAWLRTLNKSKSLKYWADYLDSYEHSIGVPVSKAGYTQRPYKHNTERLHFDPEETKRLKSFSNSVKITLNNIFTTIWGIVIAKYNNVDDAVFGMVVSGRPAAVDDVDKIIGLFINTIPVRIQFNSNQTVLGLFDHIQQKALESEPHHYQSLAEIFSAHRLGDRLFDHFMVFEKHTVLNYQNHKGEEDSFWISDYQRLNLNNNYDFWIRISAHNEIDISFEYNVNRFDSDLISSLAACFKRVLNLVIENHGIKVNELDLFSAEEKAKFVEGLRSTQRQISKDKTYIPYFKKQVFKTPQNIAVGHNGVQLTYSELYKRTLSLAERMYHKGVKSGDRIAIFLPRGIDMLTGILAAFECGAAYVPIDIHYPPHRIKEILTDSEVALIVISEDLVKKSEEIISVNQAYLLVEEIETKSASSTEPPCKKNTSDLAYMIYTSGSTGRPKGVQIHQLGMINHIQAKIDALGLHAGDTIAQTASPCFDISVWQFLAALLIGARTEIIDNDVILETRELIATLEDKKVTIFESVPSLLSVFLENLSDKTHRILPELRWMIPTGEPLNDTLVKKWYACFPDIPLLNAYGPTEASDDVTHYVVPDLGDEATVIPIGKPIQNTQVIIMNKDMEVCPPWVSGEICVAGMGVGMGYWKAKEKTEKAFVKNPLQLASGYNTLYKTGDLGYLQPDGNIVCLGRIDDQVKIRGNRIELTEIEVVLHKLTDLKEAVVTTRGVGSEKQLVAFYVASRELSKEEITTHLSTYLPAYMIPVYMVQVDKIPLTTNGKVDYKQLPKINSEKSDELELPANDIEKQLVDIWSLVLKMDKNEIGVEYSFFDLGGHSLSATILINKIQRHFGVDIRLKEIFDKQTIRQLGQFIAAIVQPEIGQDTNKEIIEISI